MVVQFTAQLYICVCVCFFISLFGKAPLNSILRSFVRLWPDCCATYVCFFWNYYQIWLQFVFLIFSAILSYPFYGSNILELLQRPFYERWKMLEKEVIEPRNHERHNIYQSRNPYYRYDLEPFRVCINDSGF